MIFRLENALEFQRCVNLCVPASWKGQLGTATRVHLPLAMTGAGMVPPPVIHASHQVTGV